MEDGMNPFPRSPKSGLFYPEKKGLRNFFTEKQMGKILKEAQAWMKPLIMVAYLTGMRMGEMTKLRWEHVNLETGIIHLPSSKTLKDPSGAGQRIVMQKELAQLIEDLSKAKRSDEWVFVRGDGLPYQHWDIHKPFKALLKSLGIDNKKYSWKEIRHTTGTLLHLKGADTLAIRDQLRHTTSQTTESFYIGQDIEYQRAQIERLTLNQKAEA
jgi:integrase